jgi:flagellar motor switch protein FliG
MSEPSEPVPDDARKATALLIAMGRPLAQRLVARFNEDELRMLSRAARVLPTMSRDVVEALVEDFAGRFVAHIGHHSADVEIGAILDEGIGAGSADRPLNQRASPRLWTVRVRQYWPQ